MSTWICVCGTGTLSGRKGPFNTLELELLEFNVSQCGSWELNCGSLH